MSLPNPDMEIFSIFLCFPSSCNFSIHTECHENVTFWSSCWKLHSTCNDVHLNQKTSQLIQSLTQQPGLARICGTQHVRKVYSCRVRGKFKNSRMFLTTSHLLLPPRVDAVVATQRNNFCWGLVNFSGFSQQGMFAHSRKREEVYFVWW